MYSSFYGKCCGVPHLALFESFRKVENEQPAPGGEAVAMILIIPTKIWLILDGQKLEETDNIWAATQLLISALFIFYRKYSSHTACTREFLHICITKLKKSDR
ncbi:uncharacterized protein LOC117175166 [Belonocnema kinseyi]|uniref:uncharacterized protein LOC117175166 n=1 Tax=Belonocnema kinseyi TaxID=2817044 RepID=UPI00143CC5A9|nr:uncharacterized protein LOC117175166 [Belonocnema kinseyi]